jgi:hypothetical protein
MLWDGGLDFSLGGKSWCLGIRWIVWGLPYSLIGSLLDVGAFSSLTHCSFAVFLGSLVELTNKKKKDVVEETTHQRKKTRKPMVVYFGHVDAKLESDPPSTWSIFDWVFRVAFNVHHGDDPSIFMLRHQFQKKCRSGETTSTRSSVFVSTGSNTAFKCVGEGILEKYPWKFVACSIHSINLIRTRYFEQ